MHSFTLTELAEQDRAYAPCRRFGLRYHRFANGFPQFLNAAEQNMAGVATGLAMSGRIVFTYSIANFPILRCLEQLRNDACYHQANVISVSVGGGFSYGALGMTHHGTEDLAIMRSLPYMKVVAPGDPKEAQGATRYLAQGHGPAYLRLGRAGEPIVHKEDIAWQLGRQSWYVMVRMPQSSPPVPCSTPASRPLPSWPSRAFQSACSVCIPSSRSTRRQFCRQPARPQVYPDGGRAFASRWALGAVAEVLSENAQSPFLFRQRALPSEFTKHVGSQNVPSEYLWFDIRGDCRRCRRPAQSEGQRLC